MKRVIMLLMLSAATLFAADRFMVTTVEVEWQAFKTPKKVPVKGTFTKAKLSSKDASTVEKALVGALLRIDSKSVASGNEGRDAKLVKFFFDLFKYPLIDAKITAVKGKKVTVAFSMNGVTKKVVMKADKISVEGIVLTGSIDMLDFGLGKALKSINQACFDLHKGKTWSDVSLKAVLGFDRQSH